MSPVPWMSISRLNSRAVRLVGMRTHETARSMLLPRPSLSGSTRRRSERHGCSTKYACTLPQEFTTHDAFAIRRIVPLRSPRWRHARVGLVRRAFFAWATLARMAELKPLANPDPAPPTVPMPPGLGPAAIDVAAAPVAAIVRGLDVLPVSG